MLHSSSKSVCARSLMRSAKLYSTSSAQKVSSKPFPKVIKRATKAGFALAIAYGGGVYYSSLNDEFQSQFVKYVPLAGTLIDFLEEREFQRNGARASTAHQSHNHSVQNSLPSSIISALEQRSKSSSLTSRMMEELTEEEKLEHRKSSNSSATSALLSSDPLSSKQFFNAVSGTVDNNGERDYLPLVLVPDDRDATINQAVMSLNDLISSFNAYAISEETMLAVSQTLASVAQKNAENLPCYAQVIMFKSQKFGDLYRSYRLIWDEYLDTQDQLAGETDPASNIQKSNPVLADYKRKVAEEITETELLLVHLVNSSGRGIDLDAKDPEYIQFKTASSLEKKRAKFRYDAQKLAATSSSVQGPPISKSELLYGGIDGSDNSLKLKLALTLLVGALQRHTPAASYIQGVRDAVSSCPNDITVRENIINKALESITVPEEVDLKSVLHDILAYNTPGRI